MPRGLSRDDSCEHAAFSGPDAESAFTDAKTRLLQLRIQEREGTLIALDEALVHLDAVIGLFRTLLGGLPARCTRDLQVRRTMETAIDQMLNECADEAARRAKECSRVRDGAASSRNGTLEDDGEDNFS